MPVLVRHEGDWVGTYSLIDLEGNILDKHESHLTCQFPEDGSYAYYQINRYKWADGNRKNINFQAPIETKRFGLTRNALTESMGSRRCNYYLRFGYKGIPNAYLYEMIQISPCNNYRSRTWHWFKSDRLYQRTLIQEERMR
jgi:hypothetical protein